ncbi:MAG TPA: CTP synthase [Phycisphaerales bacterium]|nr:CTP synthase [Phycisphaerales bacterium]HMP37720.1 CTP synthase [Phycisphaerales bacterium]
MTPDDQSPARHLHDDEDVVDGVGADAGAGEASRDGREFLARFGRTAEESTEWHSPIPPGYQRGRTKYVVVVGTVMSGLGKGIFSSSLAKLVKDKGLSVAPIKMEGYLNIDSGTLNPFRHGEVFVLDDGMETDMDLGTYERVLNQDLSRRNFITAGQIYTEILERERRGGYLGRDVQMIPHVTGTVKLRLRELATGGGPGGGPVDVVFVEIGGTAGDYENGFYIEALRELAFEEGPDSTCFVALTYIIEPQILGEQKSKAAQLGIKRLMEAGIQPHIVACRAHNPVTRQVMEKIAMFSNVPMKRVFSMHDRESIYVIPDSMRSAGLDREILSLLGLHDRADATHEDACRQVWSGFVAKLRAPRRHRVVIGITGKYAALRDAYASIDKALEHCAAHLSAQVDLRWIDTSEVDDGNVAAQLEGTHGIIVPGGFGQRGVEGKIACVRHARNSGLPYLGICLGFQVAVIEYARGVLGLPAANSTEFDPRTPDPVISELPEQKRLEGLLGGTMRLGAQDVLVDRESLASFLYGGRASVRERFRHRYEVEPAYIERLAAAGLRFSGRHPRQPIMQILELDSALHPYFIGAQFHPELTSRPLAPQPLFMGLVAAAIARSRPELSRDAIGERWLRPRPRRESAAASAPPPATVST